jgi:hypothetical protein
MALRFSYCIPAVAACVLSLSGCGRGNTGDKIEFQMGDRVSAGPLTFNVIETAWRSQLGEGFTIRTPENRFLLITISATNGGGHDVSVPLLTLEGSDGKTYKEVENGEGVDRWFGLLRTLNPAQTQQGQLLFDVPLGTYRLKLSDGADSGTEHTAFVVIPLSMDADSLSMPDASGK